MNTPPFYKRRKFWKRFFILLLAIPLFLVGVSIGILYIKQDDIVQTLISSLNKDFKGKIEIKDSHITPFDNFPYISVDLENVKIYESKEDSSLIIADIKEVFLGFDLSTIVKGNLSINDIKLKNGTVDLIQHIDGTINIENALSHEDDVEEIEDINDEFHLAIHEIELENEIEFHIEIQNIWI